MTTIFFGGLRGTADGETPAGAVWCSAVVVCHGFGAPTGAAACDGPVRLPAQRRYAGLRRLTKS
ncbi:hypothetical protein OPKNFCMD_2200 [Methylobacterium crusticola]|uniref:Uncharacterized protein n=1 Tax=Methylobacterium crusticola TaxID=1697972 RepID=A0ABQ4QW80_9HYPH|nr:hypothetical protein [Methylobacterium crusticola]GJD49469.1 hypothetical protein OPKNFCMD_2200 [Methylobacterium crusticola]